MVQVRLSRERERERESLQRSKKDSTKRETVNTYEEIKACQYKIQFIPKFGRKKDIEEFESK